MPYVVTGFYTPNYSSLADSFAANLDAFGIPHHLYPHAFNGGNWDRQIMSKPFVVQRAMRDFPGKNIILMDIDCLVRGELSPVVQIETDIAFSMTAKLTALRSNAWPSTRTIVFRPTPGAKRIIEAWAFACRQVLAVPYKMKLPSDEQLLMRAVTKTEWATYTILPEIYSGQEIDNASPDAVIVHNSAHDNARPAWELRKALKSLRRRFIGKILRRDYVKWKYGE